MERRELLTAQSALAYDFTDLAAVSHCSSAGAIDACGAEAIDENRTQLLWNETVRPYLADDLWQDSYQYDAGHNLMVPLHAAFQWGDRAWRSQFADHFRRFADAEASRESPSDLSLGRIQYLYLASRFVSLAHQAGEPELVAPSLVATIYESLERVWQVEPAWQWGRESFPGGVRERLAWKLDAPDDGPSFYRAIIDVENFVFAIAADLRVYERATREPEAYSPVVSEILDTAFRVHERTIVPTENGGWLMQPGVWTDHPTYAHAGHLEISDEMPELPVAGIAEDTAHAVRWPLWLTSLAEAHDADSGRADYYRSLLVGLETQFYETALVQPTEDFSTHRLTNFMDGHNGVYRWNYASHPLDGYGPYELSGVLHDGWWGFLGTERVRQTYREVADSMPFSATQEEVFLGPGTSRDRHPVIQDASAYDNGFYELTSRLASELAGWKPEFGDLPTNHTVVDSVFAETAFAVVDRDSPDVVVTARVDRLENVLHTELGLYFTGDLYENWGGAGEKWLRGAGGVWYFIKPDGELWEWDGGGSASGWLVARLTPATHERPELLYEPTTLEPLAEVAVEDGSVRVSVDEGFVGLVPVIVTADDGHNQTSRTLFVEFTQGPRIAPIADQTIASGEQELTIDVAVGGEDDSAALTARETTLEYALDTALGLTHDGDYEANWGGRREKWIEGRLNRHYFLLPDGSLHRWDETPATSGQFVATLSPEVYADPSLLHDATDEPVGADVALIDGALSIALHEDAAEPFAVEVAFEQLAEGESRWFTVTPPGPAEPSGQSAVDRFAMPSSQDRAFFTLPDSAADNPLVYTARSTSHAYLLDQRFGFETNGNLYENWGGAGEKWVVSETGAWHFVTPDGTLYAWDGGSRATGQVVATLDPSVHDDPALLYEATPDSAPGVVRAWGNRLEIDPQEGFAGVFGVEVTREGAEGVNTLWVEVDVNRTPDLLPLPDLDVVAAEGEVVVDLVVDDPDDASHDFAARAWTHEAFLDETLGFASSGDYFTNWGGANEKWLVAADSTWYFVLPDGSLYLWDQQASATGQLVAQLSADVYANPALLNDADRGEPFTAVAAGETLSIDFGDAAPATYVIDVTVTDGLSTDREWFLLRVA